MVKISNENLAIQAQSCRAGFTEAIRAKAVNVSEESGVQISDADYTDIIREYWDVKAGPAFPSMPTMVMGFYRTMRGVVKSGAQPVEQEEAERRAAICADCPRNIPIPPCQLCRSTVNLVGHWLIGKHTSKDEELKGCGVCGCSLATSVWVPVEPQREALTVDQKKILPQRCWKK